MSGFHAPGMSVCSVAVSCRPAGTKPPGGSPPPHHHSWGSVGALPDWVSRMGELRGPSHSSRRGPQGGVRTAGLASRRKGPSLARACPRSPGLGGKWLCRVPRMELAALGPLGHAQLPAQVTRATAVQRGVGCEETGRKRNSLSTETHITHTLTHTPSHTPFCTCAHFTRRDLTGHFQPLRSYAQPLPPLQSPARSTLTRSMTPGLLFHSFSLLLLHNFAFFCFLRAVELAMSLPYEVWTQMCTSEQLVEDLTGHVTAEGFYSTKSLS